MKLNKYLEKNKPIIIKNYLKKNLDEKKKIIESINSSKENNFFLRGSKYIDNKYKIIDNIKKKIDQDKYKIDEKIRCWNHNNGNLTKNHYDGNGVDVINICIKGKKKFIFSKPDSHINIPYTNISLLKLDKEEEILILEENDLLLIPRFWYHTVETLEDNTYMLSITVSDLEVELNDNKKLLYILHKFYNTNMCNENIINNKSINNINLFNFLIEYVKESIVIILLVIFLNNYLNDKNKLYNIIINIILFLIKDSIGKDSCGMVQLIIINYSIINFLYLFLERIYKLNKFNLISMENK
jgi:hypothetical protein